MTGFPFTRKHYNKKARLHYARLRAIIQAAHEDAEWWGTTEPRKHLTHLKGVSLSEFDLYNNIYSKRVKVVQSRLSDEELKRRKAVAESGKKDRQAEDIGYNLKRIADSLEEIVALLKHEKR